MAQKPFVLSIKVLIRNRSGELLLLQRSMQSKNNPGKWDLPGGKMEESESFDSAVYREVCEETGLNISSIGVAGATESESPTKHVVYLILQAVSDSGEVHLSDEHMNFAWVSASKLRDIDIAPQLAGFVRNFATFTV